MKNRTGVRGVLAVAVVAVLALAAWARADIVGYWDFNEGTGTNATDWSGNNNNGTLQALPSGNVPTWTTGHTGLAGDYALSLSQGNVVVPDATSLHISNQFTIAAWIYDTGDNYGHLFSAGDASNNRKWLLQDSAYGGDSDYFWSDVNNSFKRSLGYVTPLNGWHHLLVTYNGSSMLVYGDGVLKNTINFSASLSQWATLHIGADNVYGSGVEGKLDDAIILNNAVDATGAAAIMNGTYAGMIPEPGSLQLLVLLGSAFAVRRRFLCRQR